MNKGRHEVAHSPRSAEITENEVLLTERLCHRVVLVPWNEMFSLSAFLGDQDAVQKKPHLRKATLTLKNGDLFELDRQIAPEIREAYRRQVGHYPVPGI